MGGLVSVIIPSYRAGVNLKNAIDSVLSQTYRNYEIIVVDDNNPDSSHRESTKNIMKSYEGNEKVKYLCHDKNRNGAAARNTGIKAARGTYIAFLDDDDTYYEGRLEKCVTKLEEQSEYDGVYTNVDLYSNGRKSGIYEVTASGRIWRELLLQEGLLGTGSNLFLRQTAVAETGVFDEAFLRYQDVEYMLRFLQRHPIAAIKESLVRKNISNRNIPSYPKYRLNKGNIFNKFDYLIKQLSTEEQLLFFEAQYKTLMRSALMSGEEEYIKQASRDLRSVRPLTLNEKISVAIPGLWKFYVEKLININRHHGG